MPDNSNGYGASWEPLLLTYFHDFQRAFSRPCFKFWVTFIHQDCPSAKHSSWWIFILRAWILSWIFAEFLGPSVPLNERQKIHTQKSTAKFTTKSLQNPPCSEKRRRKIHSAGRGATFIHRAVLRPLNRNLLNSSKGYVLPAEVIPKQGYVLFACLRVPGVVGYKGFTIALLPAPTWLPTLWESSFRV